jgi:hypothetical protein
MSSAAILGEPMMDRIQVGAQTGRSDILAHVTDIDFLEGLIELVGEVLLSWPARTNAPSASNFSRSKSSRSRAGREGQTSASSRDASR